MAKVLYKPIGLLAGILAGVVASQIFERVWALLGSGEEPPDPEDREATWSEVIISSALTGAIFATVRVIIQRFGAKGFERATGVWPGSERSD